MPNSLSIVITTFNRSRLVGRAIDSALRQTVPGEVIVVDDASTDATIETIRRLYPQVTCLRQTTNQGPNAARQRGLEAASGHWVITLDDDDEIHADALRKIDEAVSALPSAQRYPLIQFPRSNGGFADPMGIVSLDDYLRGRLWGDFLHVIQRDVFLAQGLAFPSTRLGAEHLLLWKLAQQYGIPTWNWRLATLHADAPERLTSWSHQIRRAEEYASMQELTLETFGEVLQSSYPSLWRQKRLGAAAYWLLAGRREAASPHLKCLRQHGDRLLPLALQLLSLCPTRALKGSFLAYRSLSARLSRRPAIAVAEARPAA